MYGGQLAQKLADVRHARPLDVGLSVDRDWRCDLQLLAGDTRAGDVDLLDQRRRRCWLGLYLDLLLLLGPGARLGLVGPREWWC